MKNKIDFFAVISVSHANPNGDPLNGNRPREDYEGYGEISDVCLKRKLRNRLQDMGESIFVQMDERKDDGFNSLSERAAQIKSTDYNTKDEYAKIACEKWMDVRSFGQVFAFKSRSTDKKEGISVGVRGPVSIHSAFSVDPVDISSLQITKSVNSEPTKDGGKSSDTMGMKHRVDFGVYTLKGSINCQLAEKTGFTDEDAEKIHKALISIFDNDASAARPEGSMTVEKLYWWKHKSKVGDFPSSKMHNQVKVLLKDDVVNAKSIEDYNIIYTQLPDVEAEIYEI